MTAFMFHLQDLNVFELSRINPLAPRLTFPPFATILSGSPFWDQIGIGAAVVVAILAVGREIVNYLVTRDLRLQKDREDDELSKLNSALLSPNLGVPEERWRTLQADIKDRIKKSSTRIEELEQKLADPNSNLLLWQRLFLAFRPPGKRGIVILVSTYAMFAYGVWIVFGTHPSWHVEYLLPLGISFLFVFLGRHWALEARRISLGGKKLSAGFSQLFFVQNPKDRRMLLALLMFWMQLIVLSSLILISVYALPVGYSRSAADYATDVLLALGLGIYYRWGTAEWERAQRDLKLPPFRTTFRSEIVRRHSWETLYFVSAFLLTLRAAFFLLGALLVINFRDMRPTHSFLLIFLALTVSIPLYASIRTMKINSALKQMPPPPVTAGTAH